MKLRILWIAAIGFVAGQALAQNTPVESSVLKTDKDKFSYALGMYYGGNWRDLFARQGFELDLDTVLKGLKDSLYTNKTLLTDTQMNQILIEEEKKWNDRRTEKLNQQAAENRKKSDDFLADNKNKPGIKATENGLQYKVMTEGTGTIPGSNDTVTVNYKGTLIDGTEWDSTSKRGQPAVFPLSGPGVPKFWGEALTKMKTGAKWQLFVPPDLAYGQAGRGSIPGNSLLILDVELVSTAPPAPPPATSSAQSPLTSDIIKVPSLEEMKNGAKIETLSPQDVEREIQKQKELQRIQALTNGAPQLPK